MEGGDHVSVTIGVIVPCRDEARVILRRLENLRLLAWPPGEHRVVLVDDGSTDQTRERVAAWEEHEPLIPFEFDAVVNDLEPGKAGAIRRGLAALGESVDLVVLSDADIVVHPRGLEALVLAFEADPNLAIACGAQRFVSSLAGDGSLRGASHEPLIDASNFYDRMTSRVRAWESRFGRLVSVHGQWLAWRRELGLEPRTGIAADDLDLLFQARQTGGHARRLPNAWFVEVKTPKGPDARAQGLRRARAWFQVFDATPQALGDRPLDRLQDAIYRFGPRWLPEMFVCALLVTLLGLWMFQGPLPRIGIGLMFFVLVSLAWRLPLGLVRRARSSANDLSDRWATPRL